MLIKSVILNGQNNVKVYSSLRAKNVKDSKAEILPKRKWWTKDRNSEKK